MSDGAKPLPGVLRWNLGDLTVTVLNDGWFEDKAENLVAGIPADEAVRLQEAGFRQKDPRVTLNAFLVTGPGRKPLLIDAGYGPLAPVDTLGRVPDTLATIGISPDEIETVLVSHLHPDHIGGLLAENGKARFPKAEIVLHADEVAHWLTDEALASASEGSKPYHENARKVASAYEGCLREHRGGEVAPGIVAVLLPGHTPGHTGFRITSGGKTLMMWTDIVHLPAIQFASPDAGVSFDVDGDTARDTRKRILADVADGRTLIAGSHLEFPGIGHVTRDGDGYRFVPELWVSGQA